jgi:hypothetical protein
MREFSAEIKKNWIEALRSGRYEQGRGALRTHHLSGDRFCCLGVLADVVGLQPITNRSWLGGSVSMYGNANGEPVSSLLDVEVGLPQRTAGTLARMNDAGCSFDEIADFIERNVAYDGRLNG